MGYPVSLQDRAEAAYENSKAHGFWENTDAGDIKVIGLKLALIHSEVSEALEAARVGSRGVGYEPDGKPDGLLSELADVVIRCFDLAEALRRQEYCKETIESVIRDKMHGKQA